MLLTIDFWPLLEPCLNKDQKEIDQYRVDMATVAMVQAELEPGKIIPMMNGEYTGDWHKTVKATLASVCPHCSIKNHAYIKRILM